MNICKQVCKIGLPLLAGSWVGLMSSFALAENSSAPKSSVRFSISYPSMCAITVTPVYTYRGMSQKQLDPYEHWCKARQDETRRVDIKIFASAFKIIPEHVQMIESNSDGFWKWFFEAQVKKSIAALSQRHDTKHIKSGYAMHPSSLNPAGADACMTFEHDFQVGSISSGFFRSDNSGFRCVVYDRKTKIASTVLLEYIENRIGAPTSRSVDFSQNALKTIRSLKVLGNKTRAQNK